MSARTLLFIFLSLGLLWDAIAEILEISQRKKPLPEAVSDIYSQEDIKSAVECVKKDFRSLRGCKLYSLSYAGDEQVQRETERQLRQDSQYEEYIVIDSAFRSPIFGGGAWSAARIYTWGWILGRNAGGEWVVIDKGYC